MKNTELERNWITVCQLEDGSEHEYDYAMSVAFAEKNPGVFETASSKYVYLGKGYITEIDGKKVRNSGVLDHFWKYK